MDPELYLDMREKEGRLYPDTVVARLPFIREDHPLAAEWRARSASAWRLVRYLSSKSQSLSILDLGCGNGWLSNLLSKSGHSVTGLDENRYELQQAARVFLTNQKLSFLEADIFSAPFAEKQFDVIVLASVLQYFPNVHGLVSTLLNYLKPQGEIHILDTPLYSDNELSAAVLRSHQYYTSLGFPKMIEHYYHHRLADFDRLNPKILYHPRHVTLRLKRWIGQSDSPFPWLMLRKIR